MNIAEGAVVAGKYRIVSLIGAGGVGEVFRARDDSRGRDVALKILSSNDKRDQIPERFVREAVILTQLKHPHIVECFEFGSDDDTSFIAMELVEGGNLQQVIDREGALAPERVLRMADQIAAALVAAHGIGVVHRDLKPDNILLADEPEPEFVKIIDFGFAKLIDLDGATIAKLTAPGMAVGTVAFMSPEQCEGHHSDVRSDIYSFGALLFFMLTGDLPFDAGTPVEIMHKHLFEEARPISVVRADIQYPNGLEMVVARCMAKNPKARYPSAEDLRVALEMVAQERGRELTAYIPKEQLPDVELTTKKQSSKKKMIFAAAASVLLLGGAYAWSVMSPKPKQREDYRVHIGAEEFPVAKDANGNEQKFEDLKTALASSDSQDEFGNTEVIAKFYRAADEIESGGKPERLQRDAHKALETGDYAKLEQMAADARTSGQKEPDGTSYLTRFYNGVTLKKGDPLFSSLIDWNEQKQSATSRTALALSELNFDDPKIAIRTLAAPISPQCPIETIAGLRAYYVAEKTTAKDAAQMNALAEASLKKFPLFAPELAAAAAHYNVALKFVLTKDMPSAQKILAALKAPREYAQAIAQTARNYIADFDYIEVDRAKLNKGMAELDKEFPDSPTFAVTQHLETRCIHRDLQPPN